MSPEKLNILVADDESSIREGLKQICVRDDHRVILAEDGHKAIELSRADKFHVAFIDLKMPGMEGLAVLDEIKKYSPATEVVIITGFGTIGNVVEAMRSGAYDYIPKPFTPKTIRLILNNIIEKRKLLGENRKDKMVLEYSDLGEVIVGSSPRMQEIYSLIHKVAPTDSTVLITGETGTG
ncbi:response regulator, partial [candidate division KSB1 bacterium]|nr:response regulator [candidate division KSB1 bacterium]